jgi:3-hydroxybutyryl-CoA dehydrogenase
MPSLKRILILGESPLVEEYSSLCQSKGFEVSVRFNTELSHGTIPKGVKKISKVARSIDVAFEVTNITLSEKRSNLVELDKGLSQRTPILSSSLTVTATEQSGWISHPERVVGIGALPTLLESGMIEVAPSLQTDVKAMRIASELGKTLGRQLAEVKDSVGLVLPRILCMLANEACFAMMEKVASAPDIDIAMKLGTNYPRGPLEWAEKLGPRHVHAVVMALHRFFCEERYKPAPLLQLAAAKNTFF